MGGVLGPSRAKTPAVVPAATTVIYEPPLDPGKSPFTMPTDIPRTTAAAHTPQPGVTPAPQPSLPPLLAARPTLPPPGLGNFGGTTQNTVCDRELLITDLQANPAALRAWAGVAGVSTQEVPGYIRALHPALVLTDARVTNHALINTNAVAYQSILVAGTAVLVNDAGKLVTRCRSGNPLKDAAPVANAVCQGCPSGYTLPQPLAQGQGPNIAMDVNAPEVQQGTPFLQTPAPGESPAATATATPAATPTPTPVAQVIPDTIRVTQGSTFKDVPGSGTTSSTSRSYSFSVTSTSVAIGIFIASGPGHFKAVYTDPGSTTYSSSICRTGSIVFPQNNGNVGSTATVTVTLVSGC